MHCSESVHHAPTAVWTPAVGIAEFRWFAPWDFSIVAIGKQHAAAS